MRYVCDFVCVRRSIFRTQHSPVTLELKSESWVERRSCVFQEIRVGSSSLFRFVWKTASVELVYQKLRLFLKRRVVP